MSTPGSRKARLATAAIVVALLVYVGANIGLTSFARSVETAGLVHPYPSEDWLRYLVPSMFSGDRESRIMLAGPSSVREALLYDRFNEAFPGRTIHQGAIAMGSFEDQLLALEYVERVYGSEALPSVMVLGLSARFVANLPPNRPFARYVTDYSRWYSVVPGESGLRLEPKSALSATLAEVRFRTEKQVARYRSAVWGRIAAGATAREAGQGPGRFQRFLLSSGVAPLLGIEEPLEDGLESYAAFQAAPYKWHQFGWPAATSEKLLSWVPFEGYWSTVYRWNPTADSAQVLDYFDRLHALVERLDIELFYVSMPEHPAMLGLYAQGARDAYRALIRRGAGDTPLLDIDDLLGEHDFYDPVHPILPAARLVTDSVISFMKLGRCASYRGVSGDSCPNAP